MNDANLNTDGYLWYNINTGLLSTERANEYVVTLLVKAAQQRLMIWRFLSGRDFDKKDLLLA